MGLGSCFPWSVQRRPKSQHTPNYSATSFWASITRVMGTGAHALVQMYDSSLNALLYPFSASIMGVSDLSPHRW